MKSLIKKLLPAVVVLGVLMACEDVPAPYYLLEKIVDKSVLMEESFSNSLGKWTTFNESDDGYEWANQYNSAYISGYQNKVNKATKAWLISPAIDLTDIEQAYVTFEYVLAYKRSTTKERVLVSANYADQIIGSVHGTPLNATWYDLDVPLEDTGTDYKNFLTTGAQFPPEVMGQKRVYIALYYEAPENEASTWEVKNLSVREGVYEGQKKPEVDAIFYSTLLGDEAGFTIENAAGELPEGFSIWTNSSQYGWVASGYDKTTTTYYSALSRLSSPEITLPEGDSYFSFMHALNYSKPDLLNVYVWAVDENRESAPNGGKAVNLTINWPSGSDWNFVSSGEISLSEWAGHTIMVVFEYSCDGQRSNTGTWEIKNFGVYEGKAPEPVKVETEGSGTAEDPYTVADALKIITSGAASSSEVYVHGFITSLGDATGKDMPGNSYGNATYFIADKDASGATVGDPLEVFRGYGLGGEKMTTSNYIKVGDDVIVKGTLVYYNNKTPEFTQGSQIYSLNGQTASGGGGDDEFGEPAGSGTKDNPYNVAATVRLIDGLGTATSDYIYTKGIITSLGDASGKDMPGNSYGNATYFISDMDASGAPTGGSLEVFRGYGLGGAEMTSNYIKVGDVVVVYGKVKLYNGKTREFDQGSVLYSLNGETLPDVPEAEPKGSGTLTDPYNAAAATKLAQSLAKDAKSDVVYIYGKVATIKNNGNYDAKNASGQYYGNATFFISDDGSTNNTFQVYQALYLGNKKYDGTGDLLKQGDDVIICGKITNYNGNTPETVKGEAYLYSLNGNTGEDNPPTPPVEAGTYDNPWTVADVQANYKESDKINSYVTGYIVGYVKGSKYAEGALFGVDAIEAARSTTSAPSNILIGTNPNATSVDECIPMALPIGDIRNALNLKEHPELIGNSIKVYGSVEKYFQVAGLKSPTYVEYENGDPTTAPSTAIIGTRPDASKKRFSSKRK